MSSNLTKQEDVYSGKTSPNWDMLASEAGGMLAVKTGSRLAGEAEGMLAVETGSTLTGEAGGMLTVETGSALTGEAGGMLAVETGSTLTGEAGGMLASEARGTLDEEAESPETDRDAADMVKRFPAKTNDKLQVYHKNDNSLLQFVIAYLNTRHSYRFALC